MFFAILAQGGIRWVEPEDLFETFGILLRPCCRDNYYLTNVGARFPLTVARDGKATGRIPFACTKCICLRPGEFVRLSKEFGLLCLPSTWHAHEC